MTALLSALPRTITDIPWAEPVYYQARHRIASVLPEEASKELLAMAPELEARYKLIDSLISRCERNQVLELASGLSTRGVVFSDIISRYIEIELEPIASLKRTCLSELGILRPGLEILAGDVNKDVDIAAAVSRLNLNDPVTVVSEGLFWYLNWAQKARLAEVIWEVLEASPSGVWITGDAPTLNPSKVQLPENNRWDVAIDGYGQLGVEANAFLNYQQFADFATEHGFSVTPHSLTSVQQRLVSPRRIQAVDSRALHENLAGYATVAVLTPRHDLGHPFGKGKRG